MNPRLASIALFAPLALLASPALAEATSSAEVPLAQRTIALPAPIKDPLLAHSLATVPFIGSFYAATYVGTTPISFAPSPALTMVAEDHLVADTAWLLAGPLLMRAVLPIVATSIGDQQVSDTSGVSASLTPFSLMISFGMPLIERLWMFGPYFGHEAVRFNQRQYQEFGYHPWFAKEDVGEGIERRAAVNAFTLVTGNSLYVQGVTATSSASPGFDFGYRYTPSWSLFDMRIGFGIEARDANLAVLDMIRTRKWIMPSVGAGIRVHANDSGNLKPFFGVRTVFAPPASASFISGIYPEMQAGADYQFSPALALTASLTSSFNYIKLVLGTSFGF